MTRTTPTFVAEYESAWTTTATPKTVTPTIAANDRLIIGAMTGNDTTQVNTPTDNLGTHLTYNLLQTIQVTDYCFLRLWEANVNGGQSGSFTLSLARTATSETWGFNCLRYSGVESIGNSNKTNVDSGSGGASLSLTSSAEDSLVVCFLADWNADGTARTWRTVNSITPTSGNGKEKTYANASGVYTVYGAHYDGVGAAGANTYGLTAPSVLKYSIAAVELVGPSVGGGPAPFNAGFFDGI